MGAVANIRLQTALLLAIGFTGLLIYAFPGFMSMDSVAQLGDARSHQYSDWHPPMMAAIWTVMELFVKGPALMLLVQGTLFLLGTFGILRRVLSERKAAMIASSILLFPPVLAPMAVIWKDSQMAGFLLTGIALLLDERRSRQLIALLPFTIAAALRDNAAVAILPLIVLLFRWRGDQRHLVRIAIALAVWIVCVATAAGTNKLLTKRPSYAWYVSMGPPDIIGILKQSRTYSDADLIKILDGTPLVKKDNIQPHARTYYNPYSWWNYMAGPLRIFDWPVTGEQRAAIKRAWWQMVRENPDAYFFHRLRVFRGVLGKPDRPVFDPVWHAHGNLPDLSSQPLVESTGHQFAISQKLLWVAEHTPLFRVSVYFFSALALLWLARRQRDVLALLLSGLLYELTLFLFAPSPDFRYSHWLVTVTIISAVILFVRRLRANQIDVAEVAARRARHDRVGAGCA